MDGTPESRAGTQEVQQHLVEPIELVEGNHMPAVLDHHSATQGVVGDGGRCVLARPQLTFPRSNHQHRPVDPGDDVADFAAALPTPVRGAPLANRVPALATLSPAPWSV
jgi:hypothetical protein